MNIGLDISQIVYAGSGVSRFTSGLTNAILEHDTDNTWTFFFSTFRQKLDTKLKKRIENSRHSLLQFPFPPTVLSILFNDLHSFSKFITCNSSLVTKLDYFITSDWIEPPLPVKKATIVHDLVFKKYPETVHKYILKTQEARLKHVAKESDLIFVDSESTGNDLKEEYMIDQNRIVVNYPGVATVPLPKNTSVLQKHHITTPYILSVGKLEPRKNIPQLIDAFNAVRTTSHHDALKLIIVGPNGWGEQHIEQSENVQLIGYVDDEELATLYSKALFFVYPSLYEGFGYPLIEAMRYNCPVATSNTSSLTEIAGDAAVLFDPQSTNSIRDALVSLIADEKLRSELIQKGKKQAAPFTWERYYNTLINTLTR